MTTDKPRLLWHSNAGWVKTGYGEQTGLFTPLLNETYEVGISAFYGLQGARLMWEGMVTFPAAGDGDLGDKSLPAHAKAHFRGDPRGGLVVTLFDVWAMNPAAAAGLNMASWVPVDHQPAPPRVVNFFRQSGSIPIAMSKFGQDQLRAAGLDPLYVPHGIDTSTYRPIDQEEARALTKLPQDKYLVGMVAANKGNPSRKCFAEAFMGFKAFHERHPDSALYLHTEATGMFQGVDLGTLARQVGIPQDALYLPDQERLLYNPVDQDTMAHIFSSLDVHLLPSAGEGFGIPVLEAAACGIPSIVTDFSAQPEVAGSGWTVGYEPHWTVQEAWQAKPLVREIVESLDAAYRRPPAEVSAMAGQARHHAETYDVNRVLTEHMLPALEEVQRRVSARAASVTIEAP